MNCQLESLVCLQNLDTELRECEQQRQRIPKRLRAAQVPVDETNKRLQDIQVSLDVATGERKNGEHELSEHERLVQKLQERLHEVKTNREYQAHLAEIEAAKKKTDVIEDRILRAMEQCEEQRQELEEVQKLLQNQTQSLEEEQAKLDALSVQLTDEIAQIDDKKQELASTIDKDVWQRYHTLQSSLNVVVVRVHGGTCNGCQLHLPPQLVASVKRSDTLQTCLHCHRILYDPETVKTTSSPSM